MAKADIKMPDEFLDKLKRLGENEDAIAEKALQAGGEVVLNKARSNLTSAVGRNTKYKSRSTGQLVSALGLSSVKLDKDGNHNIKVGFSELRRDGESNAKLASILEYGKHGQPAKPFMKPAKSASKASALEAMKQVLETEMNKV